MATPTNALDPVQLTIDKFENDINNLEEQKKSMAASIVETTKAIDAQIADIQALIDGLGNITK
jgi:hypothetical protein